jgi:hypothetical protein
MDMRELLLRRLQDIQENDPIQIQLSTTLEDFWINYCIYFLSPFLFLPIVTYTYFCTITVSIWDVYGAEVNIYEEKISSRNN